jgi:RNA polymerase sigma-70 factor (ECF subfamily)
MDDFYNRYYLGLKVFVGRKIDDPDLVEELVNDILLAGYKSRQNFLGKSEEFSWLCGIAKHKIIDYYRKKKIKTVLFSVNPVFEEIADKALSPERDVLKNELKAEIKKTLRELKAGYGKILRLKYVQGRSTAAIAKKLKTTVKAIESKLHRAKKQFQTKWNYDEKKAKEYCENKRANHD